jgi:Bacterial protein of unknown function (DUF882)
MHRSLSSATTALFAAFTVGLWPAMAAASPPATKAPKTARIVKAHACARPPVEVAAGAETATFSLVDCNGSAIPAGVDQLSVLARPGSAPKPKERIGALARAPGPTLAPGIRRIDPRLVERLELVVDHFHKDGRGARVEVVSGYRPKSAGSFHSTGRALDFKLEGVKNEEIVSFCKTLPDTGCGYYPNSLFVHIDVRERGAGHVSWIDASHPGEAPRYVTSWPPQGDPAAAPSEKLPSLPADDHTDTLAPEQPKKSGSPLFY